MIRFNIPENLFAVADASLPCPFCGFGATLPAQFDFRPDARVRYSVACSNEDCPVEPCVWGDTPEEAMTTWNLRAPLAVSKSAVDAAFLVIDNQGSMQDAIAAAVAVMQGKVPLSK